MPGIAVGFGMDGGRVPVKGLAPASTPASTMAVGDALPVVGTCSARTGDSAVASSTAPRAEALSALVTAAPPERVPRETLAIAMAASSAAPAAAPSIARTTFERRALAGAGVPAASAGAVVVRVSAERTDPPPPGLWFGL